MKICVAQTRSLKGELQKNIKAHIRLIKKAISLDAKLIIFPELSLSNYEPNLAKALATTIEDKLFLPFQTIADENDITIGIGMPSKTTNGERISLFIFQAKQKGIIYSKQMLHVDELPFFVEGTEQVFITIENKKIAFGICYESLQTEHFLNAKNKGADIYIASVAKPKSGIEKAYAYFPKIANEFNTAILLSNCLGACDNFISVGQSAVWDPNGKLLQQLDDTNQGILIYDTQTQKAEAYQLIIEKGKISDLDQLFQIYLDGKNTLIDQKIFQWTDNYPNRSIIQSDLEKEVLFVLRFGNKIIGAINLSEEQEKEYASVDWQLAMSNILVIHRLIVNPKYQNQGYANILMGFAENFAKTNNYSAIRLDVYSKNPAVVQLYKRRGYQIVGSVYFPEREFEFYCMEKEV